MCRGGRSGGRSGAEGAVILKLVEVLIMVFIRKVIFF